MRTGTGSPAPGTFRVRNCPGRYAGSGPSPAKRNDVTVSLSWTTSVTVSVRKPGHAGGGATATPAGWPASFSSMLLEGPLPAGTEGGDVQRREQPVGVVTGQVEEGVALGDRHAIRPARRTHDLVAGPHDALGQHAQVEAGPVVSHEQGRQLRLAHPHPHPEAGHPRLGHLELRLTDPVAVADADLVVRQPLDREVLAECPVLQVVAAETPASAGRTRSGRRERRASPRRARRDRPVRRRPC